MTEIDNNNLNNKITKLEDIVSILSKENCVFILANIMINGTMNYDDLKQETKLAKATIFRNLNLLLGTEYISKERDESIEDKRKSTIYFRSKKEFKIPLIDRELIDCLNKENKMNLLISVSKYQNSLSDALVRVMTLKSNNQKLREGVRGQNLSFMVLFERAVAPSVEQKVKKFVEEIQNEVSSYKINAKRAIEQPVLLRINYMQSN